MNTCRFCGTRLTEDGHQNLDDGRPHVEACEDAADAERGPQRRLTRHERMQMAADAGYDTWDDYRGER